MLITLFQLGKSLATSRHKSEFQDILYFGAMWGTCRYEDRLQ